MEATMQEEFDKLPKQAQEGEWCLSFVTGKQETGRWNTQKEALDYGATMANGRSYTAVHIPSNAQEGLEKLGEKIGTDEWREIFTEAWRAYMDTGEALEDYLVRLYCPPKLKEK